MIAELPGIDVLNIGHGHLKFRFDKNDPDELAKAKKVLTDMLRRGYMIFVMVGGEQKRVRKFNPEAEEYILEEPDEIAEPVEAVKEVKARHVPMRSTRATAIGPTAGG